MSNKTISLVFLFAYFGFMAVPQWFHAYSTQFLVWLIALPFVLLILILTGAWGVFGLVDARKGKRPPNSRHAFFTKLSCAGFLWFGCSMALANCTHYLYNHQIFNSQRWQAQASAEHISDTLTPRQKMIDDVIDNILPGSTREEVYAMLGQSSKSQYMAKSGCDLVYNLGPERGLGVDSEWLLIWFDDTDDFERCEVITD